MNIIQKRVKDMLREVCREEDLPFNVVADIYLSEFRFIRDEIQKGIKNEPDTFKNIQLRYLGTFCVSTRKINWMKDRFSKNKENNG